MGVHIVNWYFVVFAGMLRYFYPDLPHDQLVAKAEFWSPVLASTWVVLLIPLFSIFSGFYQRDPSKFSEEELLPPKKFGMIAFFELIWDICASVIESNLGEYRWMRFVPMLAGLFVVILFVNVLGLIPGFEPASTSMSFTFAGGILSFLYFNYYGFKESGIDYVKHLAGPVLWMAPLLFLIELVSLFARPISLSLRLFGNISADHMVFSVFSMLTTNAPYLPIPAIFIAFGAFVACLQSFIFMTLSVVYVKLALDAKSHH